MQSARALNPPLGRPPPLPPRNFERSHSCPAPRQQPWHKSYHQNSSNCRVYPTQAQRQIGGIFLPSQRMQEKIAARWSRINKISFNYDVRASPIPHYQRNFFTN